MIVECARMLIFAATENLVRSRVFIFSSEIMESKTIMFEHAEESFCYADAVWK